MRQHAVVDQRLATDSPAFAIKCLGAKATDAQRIVDQVDALGENLLAQDTTAGAKPIVAAAVRESSAFYTGPARFELWGKPAQAKVTPKVTLELARLLVETSENQLKAAGF